MRAREFGCGVSRITAVLFLTAAVASCASTPEKPAAGAQSSNAAPPAPAQGGGVYKVGNPYQIAGTWYYPREQPDYDETGIGSWYGSEFHGRLTSNGEIFDRNAVTAAHPTLPLPSNVRVTNLDTGRSIVVRVNDRGPFKKGRLIDLSERAADLLGYRAPGTARVRVSYLGRAPLNGSGPVAPPVESDESLPVIAAVPTPKVQSSDLAPVAGVQLASLRPSEPFQVYRPVVEQTLPAAVPAAEPELTQVPVPASTAIYIQAGAYSSRENANRVVTRLGSVGAQLLPVTRGGRPLYRVRIGPFQDVDKADAALNQVTALGHNDAAIVVE
jgi:rare lipoprotein A